MVSPRVSRRLLHGLLQVLLYHAATDGIGGTSATAAAGPGHDRRPQPQVLSEVQVSAFKRDGVLVVPILTEPEVAAARAGLHASLRRHGVRHDAWNQTTAAQLRPLQLTGGKGVSDARPHDSAFYITMPYPMKSSALLWVRVSLPFIP